MEDDFSSISNNSVVVLDDFMMVKDGKNFKQKKIQFLNVINYYLRHHEITLFIIIHNLYNNGLLNEILLSPNLFLAYSNLGFYIMRYFKILKKKIIFYSSKIKKNFFRKIQLRLGGPVVLDFYQEPVRYNFHFCYINCNKNYIINCVEHLFSNKPVTMFANQEKYIIHKLEQNCKTENLSDITSNNIVKECQDFLNHTYPKNKILPLVIKIITNHDLLDENLFFISFPQIHLADFCSHINNKFDKKERLNPHMQKLCKFLHTNKIKFPKIAIKNPLAVKLLS